MYSPARLRNFLAKGKKKTRAKFEKALAATLRHHRYAFHQDFNLYLKRATTLADTSWIVITRSLGGKRIFH